MKMIFATERLKNECNNQGILVERYGAESAKLIRQRLDELFNAEMLEDMRSMPHVTIAGTPPESHLAVDLGARFLLVFRPTHEADLGDWKYIDSITILGVRKRHAKARP